MVKNEDFTAIIEQEFGYDHDQTLIVMCASGVRGSIAASALTDFTDVYDIDNAIREIPGDPASRGGRGGFQGTTYGETYEGYKGYPGRLAHTRSHRHINVQTDTDRIVTEEDSVSWMDTGLPVTFRLDPDLIPELE